MEITQIALGILILALGIPIGNYLAKQTTEELRQGRVWFKLIIIFSLLGAILFLILGNDALLFSLLFIAIVTSRSLKQKKETRKKERKKVKNALILSSLCYT